MKNKKFHRNKSRKNNTKFYIFTNAADFKCYSIKRVKRYKHWSKRRKLDLSDPKQQVGELIIGWELLFGEIKEPKTSNVTSKIGQNHCLHCEWCWMRAATVGHSPPPGFTLISPEREGGHYGWTLAASQAPARQDLSPVNSRALPQGDFLSVRSPTSSDTRWVM